MKNDVFILGLETSVDDSAFLSTGDSFSRTGENTGNLAFHHAVARHLDIVDGSTSWWASSEEINRRSGTGIIPAANQLGPHVNIEALARTISAVEHPLVMIGLGAQSGINQDIPDVPKGTVDWVREIAKRSPRDTPNIGVRGPFTLQVLEQYGLDHHAVVLGCPSLFINTVPDLGHKIIARMRAPKRIAVAAGHQRWMHLAKIEAGLAALVTRTQGSYVAQAPVEMIYAARNEVDQLNETAFEQCRAYTCPDMSTEEYKNWMSVHATVFFNVPAWMEHYRHFDLVVGTRIHGVMLAVQAGIPALCIVHDSRTLELCQTMKVPHVDFRALAGDINLERLMELAQFDADEFDENRKDLARNYVLFLQNNGLVPSPDLLALAA